MPRGERRGRTRQTCTRNGQGRRLMAGSTGVTEHQQAVSVELHTLVAGAFQALDGAGVRWVLVRGFEKLSDPTGDLDILVLPADLDAAASALGSAGFVETNSRGHGAHRFFVGYAPDEQRYVVLDLVTLFAFGPERVLRVDAVEACVARRTVTGTVARLAPDDEFWATLLHAVVNRGEIR